MTDCFGEVPAVLLAALADRYTIVRELGRGGMATVYLAHDVKHERDVAIKVLHEDLGATLGPERFLAEIKTTAKLQHPHILPLLDSGAANGLLFYVMPFVDGETLRARLTRETQLPIEDAVRIARKVADALGHAHAHGIVHRDIKPENILLQGGHAVVADFGIALAVQQAGGARLTQTGLSLGTPQYMAPEQAMAEKVIDHHADIYALGAVTYEMLTGEPPFTGATVQAIVAKVMSERPVAPSTIRDTVPAYVEAAVLKALAKLPADRHATARDFATAIQLHGSSLNAANLAATRHTTRTTWRTRLRDPFVISVGILLLLTVSALVVALGRTPPVMAALPVRFELSIPDSAQVLEQFPWPAAIAPDGAAVVYSVQRTANTQLYLHRTDELGAHPIPGTEGATQPIFSPDGQWIAFETLGTDASRDGMLRKVRLDGSAPATLTRARSNNGADWTKKDEIVLGSEGGRRGLSIVSAGGGELRELTRLDTTRGERDHLWPIALEDGETAVFVIWYGALASSELAITRLDRTGAPVRLGLKGIRPLAVLGNELVYLQADGVVMSVRIDESTLRSTSDPTPVLEDIKVTGQMNGNSGIHVSNDGALVQMPRALSRLVWRQGASASNVMVNDLRDFAAVRLSPDGHTVAAQVGDGARSDIWLFDVATGASLRFTETGNATSPSWTADGSHVTFVSPVSAGRNAVWWKRVEVTQSQKGHIGVSAQSRVQRFMTPARRSNPPAQLFESPDLILGASLSADGKTLLLEVLRNNNNEIILVNPGQDPQVRDYLKTPALETGATLSPDGRHVAFVTDESGHFEVFIDGFPDAGRRVRVSNNGGSDPQWSRDGSRILYREGTRIMAARVEAATDFRVHDPEFTGVNADGPFDATDNSGRILTVESPSSKRQLVVTTNWITELRRKIAPSRRR